MLLAETTSGRTTDLYCLKLMTFADAAANFKHDFAQGSAHRDFNQSGVHHMTGQRECLRAAAVPHTVGTEPLRTIQEDGAQVGQCFNVIDNCRLTPQAFYSRIGRTRIRHTAASFDRSQQSCLLAADKSTGTFFNIDVKAKVGTEDVFAQ